MKEEGGLNAVKAVKLKDGGGGNGGCAHRGTRSLFCLDHGRRQGYPLDAVAGDYWCKFTIATKEGTKPGRKAKVPCGKALVEKEAYEQHSSQLSEG